jgi:restriction system protein
VLEVELSNEDVPLPLEFEIEFDGVRRVQIEVTMPTLDTIPLTVSSVTKAGKFSERNMAQRDRVDLYKDVCAGLALRLVHEVFRVLPFVEHVGLRGMIEAPDPATGQAAHFVVLRLATERTPFLALSLDNVDPSEALAHLGGEMKATREGNLQPLGDLHGE